MIQFSNPAALWLLTLLAPLILLYLLKRRRRDVTVPSLMLWKQALEDTRANRPFQKLRSQLLLYLQILIVVLITAILSGPHIVQSAQESRRWAAVIDISASMQARDVSPDRFHAARNQLVDALEAASPADEIMLIAMGADVSVIEPFTTRHAALRQKLEALAPEDTPGNWARLATVLEPLIKEQPAPKIVIASDFASFPASLEKKLPFDAIRIGSNGDNVGITRVVAEPLPEEPAKQQLFYRIRSFSNAAKKIDVELKVDGRLVDAFETTMAAGSELDKSAELEVRATATVVLTMKHEDALQLDNEFVLTVHPFTPTKVATSLQNIFLSKALAALPAVTVADTAPIVIGSTKTGERVSVPGIYFYPSDALEEGGGRVLQWQASHPALRFVDAGMWILTRSQVLSPPPGSVVLLEIAGGPVAYAQETEAGRFLVLGFAIENSNIYQLSGFPVFLQNSLLWIREGIEKPLPSLTGVDARREGEFQADDGKKGFRNFADALESQIQPGRPETLSASVSRAVPRRRDLTQWFLIIALTIVMLEWWVFHRRVGS